MRARQNILQNGNILTQSGTPECEGKESSNLLSDNLTNKREVRLNSFILISANALCETKTMKLQRPWLRLQGGNEYTRN